MRRAGGILLFLVSIGASVYAFHSLSAAIGLNGNAFSRHYKETLLWGLGWVTLAVLLTIAFVITARGRWRLAAALPLAICLFVAWGITVLWPHASA
jgi:hypothetical protein